MIAALIALGAWIGFYVSGQPSARPGAQATTLPDVSAPVPRLEQPSVPGCPMPVPPPTGTPPDNPRSLYQPTRFERVLSTVRDHLGADPTIQRALYPDAAQVLYLRGRRQWAGAITAGGDYRENENGPYNGPHLGFRLSQLSTPCPLR